MAEEFSITRSLFGLDPRGAADMIRQRDTKTDSDEAYRLAQLTPEQQSTYIASRGGAMAGRNVVDLAGGLMGVDTTPRPVKLAQTTQAIMRQLQQEGYDPNNVFEIRKQLSRRLAEQGFETEAAALAGEVRDEEMKDSVARATIVGKVAQAKKDTVDAQRTPAMRLAETGKFTPESLKIWETSGNFADLKLTDPDNWTAVETADKVYLVNSKGDPKDPANRVELGPAKKTGGAVEVQNQLNFQSALKSAWEKFGRDGAEADVVMDRMRKADPQGYAMLMSYGKSAVGADNVMTALGEAKPLTEAQSNLFDFASAAVKARSIVERKGWGTARPYPKVDESFLANLQTEALKNPNAPMTLNMLVAKVGDKETREFLADYFGYLLPVLRKDTGAAIAASEWVNYFNTYVPMGNANPSDNESRIERLNGRTNAMMVNAKADTGVRRRVERLEAEEAKQTKGATLLKAGREAKGKGPEAYRAWFLALPKEEQDLVREMVKR
jgi:regulator of RNase E activity RraB